jgi:hypothetical protein
MTVFADGYLLAECEFVVGGEADHGVWPYEVDGDECVLVGVRATLDSRATRAGAPTRDGPVVRVG